MNIKHPLGNIKIYLIKMCGKIISWVSINFLGIFFDINKNFSEIIISSAFFAPWKKDIKFKKFHMKMSNMTILDNKRLYTLYYLSESLKFMRGDILDIGCLKGGAGMVMSHANKRGKTYLIDTFQGIVDKEKYHNQDHFIFKNIELIRNLIKKLKLKNTYVVKGIFPKTLKEKFHKTKIKLCHIDVNTYNSTKKTFEYLEKKVVKNGIIVFDDYGIYSVDGVKRYVDFLKKKNKKFIYINNFMGQCILIKK